jgi:hypothetical protein
VADIQAKGLSRNFHSAFDHFTRLLARPQAGNHYFPAGDDVLRSEDDAWGTPTEMVVTVPNGATGRWDIVGFGGRPLENRLAEDRGEYNAEFTMNAGSYYDKTWTAMLMTESVDNFISSTRGDSRRPSLRSTWKNWNRKRCASCVAT